MNSLSDMIVTMLVKQGVIGEFRNFETKIDIPKEGTEGIKISIKAENVQIKVDKKN